MRHHRGHGSLLVRAILLVLLAPMALRPAESRATGAWRFIDITDEAGLSHRHGFTNAPFLTPAQRVSGGVAAGDYDRDGWIDLYIEVGDIGPNLLFRNQGNGRFHEVGESAGVALDGFSGSGPLFFDFDGDGWLDLFVGAFGGSQPVLFHNNRDGTFVDATAEAGLLGLADTFSATAGDYDGDGWLDLFLSHWGVATSACHLWRNLDGHAFTCADQAAGLSALADSSPYFSFTANFADVDDDGALDLLLASDFGTSQLWLNRGDGTFQNATTAVFADENGMGSAIGDYDGDGDLDWFVSSIWDDDGVTEGNWGTSGNRLYRNQGGGTFIDVSASAGVRDGDWGWASSFADFNHDGWLDIVQVNGWPRGSAQFRDTPSRLFLGSAEGVFKEWGAMVGFVDRGDGRGLVCFDYDHDGDIDIFTANNSGTPKLWRNDGGVAAGHYISITLAGAFPNPEGIGARVHVTAGGRTQVREVRAGSNYVSQNPAEAHFGLGSADRIDLVRVVWPGGSQTTIRDLPVDRRIVIDANQTDTRTSAGCSAVGQ